MNQLTTHLNDRLRHHESQKQGEEARNFVLKIAQYSLNAVKLTEKYVMALFTLLRYRQVLLTKGLSPLPMPHSDENCYSAFHVTEVSTSFANKGFKPLAHASF
ncbi:MAG: hypothetical protein DWQ51_18525 [Microcystis wesenbergii TW10]|uniref:Uncharacterized protein n=2 Tax=Microcystis TaxID=1125 RepID=A0A552AEE0_MICAE|nr:MAG: hypothetical protein DWQ51_18525 [Microcystis wesenbergii TW10]TRT83820.1 MAG: hypothetical protein EWV63_16665 [Microcystis aeruginosa Ma_OC_H_19870700_S124]TRV00284.1 MAG: hypothetical protein EWV73_11470 [Microcystis wesenbergii Mw_QC_B_20070930_S4D]TRV07651.1 MAG: hypothetical protein EWV89_21970 [Microcystis wesenbergii Mw_QC_B_20070930_S4]